MDQVYLFILASGSVPEQVSINPSWSLQNPPYIGPFNVTLVPFTAYDSFITTIIDIDPYGACLLIIVLSGSEPSICVDYFF